jgi:hypothetical protein
MRFAGHASVSSARAGMTGFPDIDIRILFFRVK